MERWSKAVVAWRRGAEAGPFAMTRVVPASPCGDRPWYLVGVAATVQWRWRCVHSSCVNLAAIGGVSKTKLTKFIGLGGKN